MPVRVSAQVRTVPPEKPYRPSLVGLRAESGAETEKRRAETSTGTHWIIGGLTRSVKPAKRENHTACFASFLAERESRVCRPHLRNNMQPKPDHKSQPKNIQQQQKCCQSEEWYL